MSELCNNFLTDYRLGTSNKAPLVSMGEKGVKKLFEHSSKTGFVFLEGLSGQHICEIVEILKGTKFSFMPIYRKLDCGGEMPIFKRGIVLFNYNSCHNTQKYGTEADLNDLFAFGQRVAKQCGVERLVYSGANESLRCFDSDGKEFGCEDKALIFTDCFIKPAPQCYSERHVRYLKREIFLSR